METIGFYYPDYYGPYKEATVKMGVKEGNNRPLWERMAQKIFEFNNMRLPPLKPGRMLEIGCASGSFMHQMAQKGWEVAGIELSDYAASNARALGYPVHTGPLETAPPLHNRPYDLVVGWMVLEHLHDPISALKKLYQWTEPRGWLILSLPNASSYEFRFFKDRWFALQLPNHLFHFTPKTIKKILNYAGWRLVKIYHQRVLYNLFPSIGYLLSDFGFKSKLIDILIKFPNNAGKLNYFLYPIAYIFASFGQTGRMIVWARKK
jgi:2-polyprenyl-3-methyl-5-hydroxy-6-metoxy-1,4-benzoquinol methylase